MEEFDMMASIDALKSKKKTIVSMTLSTLLIAALASLLFPNVYQAKVLVYVLAPQSKTGVAPSDISIAHPEQGLAEEKALGFSSFIEYGGIMVNACEDIAMSPEILQRLIDKSGLKITVEELVKKKMVRAKIMEAYWGLSQRSYVPVVILTTEAKKKKVAQELANNWADLLAEKVNEISRHRLDTVYQVVEREADAAKTDLDAREADLADLRKSSHVHGLELELTSRERDFLSFNSALRRVQISLGKKDVPAKDAAALKEKEATLRILIDQARLEIERLWAKVIDARQRQTQREREVGLERQRYEFLAQKDLQFKASRIESSTEAKIVGRAPEPGRPVRPKRGLIIFIAGCVGLAGSALWVSVEGGLKGQAGSGRRQEKA